MDQTQQEIKRLTLDSVSANSELTRLNTEFTINNSDLRTVQQNYDQLRQSVAETTDHVVTAVPAQPPDQPVDRLLINMAMAAIVGLMLGVGLVFVLEQLDDKIRSSKDVASSLGFKTISTIAPIPIKGYQTIVDTQPFSGVAEDFRLLGAKIRLAKQNGMLNTLLVTSPTASEGKTHTTANLAIALARSGLNVTVVDADLRLPKMHEIFNLPQENGLSEYLSGEDCNGNLCTSKVKGLNVLTSGAIPDEPIELLSSPKMDKLLRDLSSHADLVLIDCPPVLPVADASILAALSDGVLLVLRSGVSEKRAACEAYENLCGSHAQYLGVVLAGIANHGNKYYKRYHISHQNTK
jgi:polysaccharide biosynthesis transport protein